MTLNNLTNCILTTFKKDNEVRIYDFIAESGYCFRNNAEPLTDENGNTYFNYSTAFSLLAHEIDKLMNYDCIQIETIMEKKEEVEEVPLSETY